MPHPAHAAAYSLATRATPMKLRHAIALSFALLLSACGGGGDSAGLPAAGGVTPPATSSTVLSTGQVVDDLGVPVSGATVTMISAARSGTGATAAPVATDAAGLFSLTLDNATAAVVSIEKAGFMRMLRAATATTDNPTFAARVAMQRVAATLNFDASQAAVLRVPGSPARVELAPNALTRMDGQPVNGLAKADLTPIDPSVNINLMPGVLVDSVSGVPIESLGALAINFSDATGAPLNLAAGQTATLRIPATPAPGATLPATFPLYYLNETTGRWVQEGTAMLQTDPVTGARYYEGTVTHFSFWNADQPSSTAFYDLASSDAGTCSYDASMLMIHSGVDFNGTTSAQAAGNARLQVRASSNSRISLHKNGQLLDSVQVTTPAVGVTGKLPRCLAEPTRVTVSGQVSVSSGSLDGYSVQLSGNLLPVTTVAINSNGTYSTQLYANRGPIAARLVTTTGRRDLPTTAVTASVGASSISLPLLAVADDRVELRGCVAGWATYPQQRAQLSLFRNGALAAPPLTVTSADNSFNFTVPVNSTVEFMVTPATGTLLERRTTVSVANLPQTLPDCLSLPKGPQAVVSITGTGLSRQFDASASTSGDAPIASLQWDFGDGATATGALTNHGFSAAGSYIVSLRITDALGQTTLSRSTVALTAGSALSTVTPASSFSTGTDHACAIRAGTPYCWGSNFEQQLGRAHTYTYLDSGQIIETGLHASTVPIVVDPAITTATAVGAGENFSCALLAAGNVKCWGRNANGELGNGNLAVNSEVPVDVAGISTARALSVGDFHACVVKTDSTIWCWGNGGSGQLGNGADATSAVPVPVSGITNAAAISVGRSHTCVVLADGAVKCWGDNYFAQLGQTGIAESTTPVTINIPAALEVSAGSEFSCAVLASGQIRCWGYRGFTGTGYLGDGSGQSGNMPTPVTVQGISTAASVSVGSAHACALLADKTVSCWGVVSSGEGGVSVTTPYRILSPRQVTGLGPVAAVSNGSNFTCTLLASGTLQCFGSNSSGKLGDGSATFVRTEQGGMQQTGGYQSEVPRTVALP